jgi:sodium-dependent dicarboxylate transporter 2/3/5
LLYAEVIRESAKLPESMLRWLSLSKHPSYFAAITNEASKAMSTSAVLNSELPIHRNPYVAWIGQLLCVVVPLAIWFSPLDLTPQAKHGFAILAFMVIAWITEATELAVAGFIGCFLFWALGVVKFDVAFSGFADATAWFLFAAMLIGLVASKSGLARRLAYSIMLRIGVTYPRILLGLIVTDFLLTFIVPSGLARVVILASVAFALTEAFHAERGSNIARGMFLILTYTGNIFDKMILAGAGSITAAG